MKKDAEIFFILRKIFQVGTRTKKWPTPPWDDCILEKNSYLLVGSKVTFYMYNDTKVGQLLHKI